MAAGEARDVLVHQGMIAMGNVGAMARIGPHRLVARGNVIRWHDPHSGEETARITLPEVIVALAPARAEEDHGDEPAPEGLRPGERAVVALGARDGLYVIAQRSGSARMIGGFDIAALRGAEADGASVGWGKLAPGVAVRGGIAYLLHRAIGVDWELLAVALPREGEGQGEAGLAAVVSIPDSRSWFSAHGPILRDGRLAALGHVSLVRSGGGRLLVLDLDRPQAPRPVMLPDPEEPAAWTVSVSASDGIAWLGERLVLLSRSYDHTTFDSVLLVDPERGTILSSHRLDGLPRALAVEGERVVVLRDGADMVGRQVEVLQVDRGGHWRPEGTWAVDAVDDRIGLDGERVWLGAEGGHITLRSLREGTVAQRWRGLGIAAHVAMDGDIGVMTTETGGGASVLLTLALSGEGTPNILGALQLPPGRHEQGGLARTNGLRVAIDGPWAVVHVPTDSARDGKLWLVDVRDPRRPRHVADLMVPSGAVSMIEPALHSGWALASLQGALWAFDLRSARDGVQREPISLSAKWTGGRLEFLGDRLLLGDRSRASTVYQFTPPQSPRPIRGLGSGRSSMDERGIYLVQRNGIRSMPWVGLPSYDPRDSTGETVGVLTGLVGASDGYAGVATESEFRIWDAVWPARIRWRDTWAAPAAITDLRASPGRFLVAAGEGGLHLLTVHKRPAGARWAAPCAVTRHHRPWLPVIAPPESRLRVEQAQAGVGIPLSLEPFGLARPVAPLLPGTQKTWLRGDAPTGLSADADPMTLLVAPSLLIDPVGVAVRTVSDGMAVQTGGAAMRSPWRRPIGNSGCFGHINPNPGNVPFLPASSWSVSVPAGLPLEIVVPARASRGGEHLAPVVAITATLGLQSTRLRPLAEPGAAADGVSTRGWPMDAALLGDQPFHGVLPGWTADAVDPSTGDVTFELEIVDAEGGSLRIPGNVRRWRIALPHVMAGTGVR